MRWNFHCYSTNCRFNVCTGTSGLPIKGVKPQPMGEGVLLSN